MRGEGPTGDHRNQSRIAAAGASCSEGWPIGSGNTEAGVKGFNKRVKGTDQFWNIPGVESILALRAMWMSQDQRWDCYWANRPSLGRCRAA